VGEPGVHLVPGLRHGGPVAGGHGARGDLRGRACRRVCAGQLTAVLAGPAVRAGLARRRGQAGQMYGRAIEFMDGWIRGCLPGEPDRSRRVLGRRRRGGRLGPAPCAKTMRGSPTGAEEAVPSTIEDPVTSGPSCAAATELLLSFCHVSLMTTGFPPSARRSPTREMRQTRGGRPRRLPGMGSAARAAWSAAEHCREGPRFADFALPACFRDVGWAVLQVPQGGGLRPADGTRGERA
jgi:hypothetical protein